MLLPLLLLPLLPLLLLLLAAGGLRRLYHELGGHRLYHLPLQRLVHEHRGRRVFAHSGSVVCMDAHAEPQLGRPAARQRRKEKAASILLSFNETTQTQLGGRKRSNDTYRSMHYFEVFDATTLWLACINAATTVICAALSACIDALSPVYIKHGRTIGRAQLAALPRARKARFCL